MRDILFRGQTRRKGEYIVNMAGDKCESHWVYGGIFPQNKDGDFAIIYQQEPEIRKFTVYAETVGQFTGLTDKNGRKIFEGDIVQYNIYDDFDCQSVVKFGEYNQDGSAGEYSARKCIGFYVDVDNFTCPDWCENNPDYFPKHFIQQNVLEIARDCQVIGNIHDSLELLEAGDNNE